MRHAMHGRMTSNSAPPPSDRRAVPAALLLAVLAAGFIVYGSLYPFRFRPLPDGQKLLDAALAALGRRPGGRGDVAANLVLYAPLGFALCFALAARLRAVLATLLAALACALLSAGMEVSQLHVAGRSSSGFDLMLNALGGGIGAAAGALVARSAWRPRGVALAPVEPLAALLLICWLAYRLYPYIPSIDLGEWRQSLAPLIRAPLLDPWRGLRLCVLWLVAARLLGVAWPRLGRALPFAALVLGMLALAVPIVDRRLTPPELLGGLLAVALWSLLRRAPRMDLWLLLALMVVVVAEATAPYSWLDAPQDFGWMPFRAVMRGHWGIGLQAMFYKFFLYGGLIWLALRAGLPWPAAAVATAALALGLSLLQTWLPGRSAESTDATLAALAAVLAWLAHRPAAAAPARSAGNTKSR
jgi:VanZ family protein